MYRIDTPDAINTFPNPDAPGPNPNSYFTNGNPRIGQPGTILQADWANAVQEELCNAIELAGLKLDKKDRTQLSKAIGTKQVGFLARKTAKQTLSHHTATDVVFDKIMFNEGNYYQQNTSTFIPKIPGKYWVAAQISFWGSPSPPPGNHMELRTVINTNSKSGSYLGISVGSTGEVVPVTAILDMNGTTDFVNILAMHYSPAMPQLRDIYEGENLTFFAAMKIN